MLLKVEHLGAAEVHAQFRQLFDLADRLAQLVVEYDHLEDAGAAEPQQVRGEANLVELTLPDDSPIVGTRVGDAPWPVDTTLVAVIRDGHVHTPRQDLPLEAHDELLLVAAPEREPALEKLLSPHKS